MHRAGHRPHGERPHRHLLALPRQAQHHVFILLRGRAEAAAEPQQQRRGRGHDLLLVAVELCLHGVGAGLGGAQ